MEGKEVTQLDLNALTMNVHREHDACGIFARIEKTGEPSKKPVQAGLEALKALRHRAGYVDGRGDGCGLLLDIPRALWRRRLAAAGRDAQWVYDEHFVVGHFFLEADGAELERLAQIVQSKLEDSGIAPLLSRCHDAVPDEHPEQPPYRPAFLQIAGLGVSVTDADCYRLTVELEALDGVHVLSLSRRSVVYKVVGDADDLVRVFDDLADPNCESSFVLGHTRFSTNTTTSPSRVQPFALLGHNGEINTIARFFEEGSMMGIQIDPAFSDSQMVDSVLHHLVAEKGWSLFAAMELLFPPILNEIKHLPHDLADMYMYFRSMWGPFAQGPAAIMTRFADEAVFSVDALGLRPMWLVETEEAYCFSSEQGIIPRLHWIADPLPLAPGEKVGLKMSRDGVRLFRHGALRREVFEQMRSRYSFLGAGKSVHFTAPYQEGADVGARPADAKPLPARTAAHGWREDDFKWLEFETQTGAEPIKSLGYDGPLPALDEGPRSVSDFLQETVAVVTNPAIDREREVEHFSTRCVLGRRPSLAGDYQDAPRIEVQSPLLLETLPDRLGIDQEELQVLSHRLGTLCYENVLAALRTSVNGTAEILIHRQDGETIEQALQRFHHEALEAVQAGANVIVLDDRAQFRRGQYIDPFLVVAAVHKSLLRPAASGRGEHLRRRCSLILRSGGLRNLHDVMCAIGLGADAVNPYLMWEVAAERSGLQGVENLYHALCKGIEKVISTIGIHELRGYERLFGAIGLAPEVAEILGVPNFCGGETAGYGFAQMEAEAKQRQELYDAEDGKTRRRKAFQLYPRIWKSAGLVGMGLADYESFHDKLQEFERDHPINLRHALRFVDQPESGLERASRVEDVDTTIDGHAYPILISSMSFGSQGETVYRAYAEAAYRLNIVGMNGEGGEIKDLLDKYPRNRGRQIASGRFGVNARLCNNAYVLEIKIGQGAKPGEGGHLPGSKVTEQVANARNASPGVDLISPSNNHDIYSIEDLAQVIHELKTINPLAKVAVKVPVVPNIGTIAVGIVKAGADIVELSGFDGGTGAARSHAIRHVGLPMEIGVKRVHEALCASGLRDRAEIWADGGMKSGTDVMKAILLGANRVGFGTMAMVAIGCTACRACHKDTCHVGIATQMTSLEEAAEKGVKSFSPREFETAVEHLVRFFTAVGEHVRRLTHQLGAKRTQDLVGRSDLLEQCSAFDNLDLTELTRINRQYLGLGTKIQPQARTAFAEEFVEVDTPLAIAVGEETQATLGYPVGRGGQGRRGQLTLVNPEQAELVVEAPRVLSTYESGEAVRTHGAVEGRRTVEYPFVAGNGFAAYHMAGMHSVAYGGAQDGVGKGAFGGRIVVLKQQGPDGRWLGGSVGKGLAYGAQHGVFIVQNHADARAGIRLSGADIVIGGEVTEPLDDTQGDIATRANIKGFGFEYMTAGRAVVLGDPGPWLCAGMTGGSVYVRHNPAVGLTEDAIRRRIAKGAKVVLQPLDAQGETDVTDLLLVYHKELRESGQTEEAKKLVPLLMRPKEHFLMIRPGKDITDQSIATE
ncbi:MAG: alpha-hydroxy-acid oxidizing protein [Alicyclobacillus herbarius]|uniref:glutamate synthase-related protein n=1 Tax=Alicyclobacillus herbarius TaxID=122960 RepID=UPI0023532CB9|nr:glutamate synthase-related protein [Alicyclobacillus herbarius]MCL6632695.1 alpha-hydroxy-acid oxidizing protein [Alicyclobacillus herbarius]